MEKRENSLKVFKPKLVEPSVDYKESYLEALREFKLLNNDDGDINEMKEKFDSFLEKMEKNKKGLIFENIPQITYWCVEGNRYIGHINYRPNLNEKLEFKGGNIGYSVRPSEQGKGYAFFMLQKVLKKAKADGLPSVMLTCNDDNLPSKKVIKKAGGIYRESAEENGKKFNRYIIPLENLS